MNGVTRQWRCSTRHALVCITALAILSVDWHHFSWIGATEFQFAVIKFIPDMEIEFVRAFYLLTFCYRTLHWIRSRGNLKRYGRMEEFWDITLIPTLRKCRREWQCNGMPVAMLFFPFQHVIFTLFSTSGYLSRCLHTLITDFPSILLCITIESDNSQTNGPFHGLMHTFLLFMSMFALRTHMELWFKSDIQILLLFFFNVNLMESQKRNSFGVWNSLLFVVDLY